MFRNVIYILFLAILLPNVAYSKSIIIPIDPAAPAAPTVAPLTNKNNVAIGELFFITMSSGDDNSLLTTNGNTIDASASSAADNYRLFVSRNNISYILSSTVSVYGSMSISQQHIQSGPAYYRYKACNGSICSNYSPTRTVQVGATAPDPLVLHPPTAPAIKPNSVGGSNFAQLSGNVRDQALLSAQAPSSNYYGETTGQGGVSGGAGTYSVPIQLVPGRAGMQPAVSLNYGSRSGSGNAGVGWSVSAGGAMSRCSATLAQDGVKKGVSFSQSTDKLCLNGERLIAITGNYGASGTEYALEQAPLTRIFQKGGAINQSSSYFEVHSSDGQRSFYGLNNDTRVIPQGLPYTLTWLLAERHDVSGNNRIEYAYEEFGDAEHLLRHIYYTGNSTSRGDRRVDIEYENREKISSHHVYGGRMQSTQRISAINTYYQTSKVRSYALTYEASAGSGRDLLKSLQECVSLSGEQCKAPLLFTWSQGLTQTQFEPLNFGNGMAYPGNRNVFDILPRGDVNGDGVRDWAGVYVNAEGTLTGTTNKVVKPCYENYLTRSPVCTDSDFDVDGLTDDWRVNSSHRLQLKYTRIDTPDTAWITTPIQLLPRGTNTAYPDSHIKHVGDYNNDGWPDLMVYHFNNYVPQLKLYTHTKDVNAPYQAQGALLYTYPTNMNTVGDPFNSSMTHDIQFMGDMDGDGTLDFIETDLGLSQRSEAYPQPRPFRLWLNSGDGRNYNKITLSGLLQAGTGESYFSYFLDINGDGLIDWLGWQDSEPLSTRLIARINQGAGSFSAIKYLYGDDLAWSVRIGHGGGAEPFSGEDMYTPVYGNVLLNADIDGDGKDELLEPGTAIVEGCAIVLSGSGSEQRCGRGLYGVYRNRSDLPNSLARIDYANKDDSIYQWNAFSFIEDSEGNFEVVKRATEFYGRVAESQFIDAFGTGLPSLVSVHKKSFTSNSFGTTGVNTVMQAHFGNYGVYISRNKGVSNSSLASDYQPHDMLVAVSAPSGKNVSWVYRPLTSDEYSQGTTPFYAMAPEYTGQFARANGDYFHFASSMYAVAAFTQANGVGGQHTSAYRYRGAVYNTKGRGFMGFRTIEVEDKTRDLITTTDFLQAFPYTGKVSAVRQRKGDNPVPFMRTDISWERNQKITNSRLYQVFASEHTETRLDFAAPNPAMPISTKVTSIYPSDLDRFGNVLKSITVIDDDFSTTTLTSASTFDASQAWPDKWRYKHTQRRIEHKNGLVPRSGIRLQNDTLQYAEAWDSQHRKVSQLRVGGGVNTASDPYCTNNLSHSPDALGMSCSVTSIHYNDYGAPVMTEVAGNTLQGTRDSVQRQVRKTSLTYTKDGSTAAPDGYFPLATTVHVSATNTHVAQVITEPRTGEALRSVDANNVTTNMTFDRVGRLASVQQQGSPIQYIRYLLPDSAAPSNNVRFMQGVFQAGTSPVYTYIDILGRTVMTRHKDFAGQDVNTQSQYDGAGNMTHQSGPYTTTPSYTTYHDFDALGRAGRKITPATASAGALETRYTQMRTTTTIETFASHGHDLTMSRTYDAQNKLISTVDALGGQTSYVYNADGHPVGVQDAKGHVIWAFFDSLGRKYRVEDPNQGTTKFWYNAFGELEKQQDANTAIQRFDMDTLGRVTHRYGTSGTATFVWDTRKKGMLSSQSTSGAVHEYYYDPLARLTLTDSVLEGTSYKTYAFYDANYNRLKGMQYPDGMTVGYYYNPMGYLQFEYNAASGYVFKEVTAQDAFGNVSADKTANAKTSGLYVRSAATGQMLLSQVKRGLSTVHHLEYADYDSYGNIKRQHNRVGSMSATDTFSYDELQRLSSSTITAMQHTETINYRFDSVGNLLHKSDYSTASGNAYSYAANSDKLMSVALKAGGLLRLGYDNMGNQTHRTNPLTGALSADTYYNELNKPTRITRHGADLRFSYDASWQRYKQVATVAGVTTTTYYIGKHYEVQSSASGSKTVSYISDTALITRTDGVASVRFTHKDRLGSTTTFTDHNGYVSGYRSYDPFGKPKMGNGRNMLGYGKAPRHKNNVNDGQNVTTRGFTNHEHLDEVELIHMNGRIYDYNLGRFLSVDPFVHGEGGSQGINPYSYIMNNPLAGVDPSGYDPVTVGNRGLFILALSGVNDEAATSNAAAEAANGNIGAVDSVEGGIAAREAGNAFVENIRNGESVSVSAQAAAAATLAALSKKKNKNRNKQKSENGAASSQSDSVSKPESTADIGSEKTKSSGRASNHLREDERANGEPHSVTRRDENGNVTNYETYNYKDGQKSTGDGKRVDVEGAQHGGVETPHVVETKKHVNPKDPSKSRVTESKTARPAREDEIPNKEK